jgi:diketogulonate reductase-like aldo/keto reductase
MDVPNVTLTDGSSVPQIALGLWQVTNEEQFRTAFDAGITNGYRHFDSAQEYKNEAMLGRAWKASGKKRKALFITTKIAVTNFGYNKTKSSFATSLEKLQTEYVDLLLLHFPVTFLREKSWKALEEIQAAGGAKNIGVSNYTIRHLEQMQKYASVTPAVNQVELHVFLQQPELLQYCHDHNIVVEAYSPLAHAKSMDDPVINKMAAKYGKTYAQIMLRWCIDQGLVVLPKSVTPSRIQENINIFDFKLDAEDMAQLTGSDKNMRTCWSPVHVP